MAKGSRGLVLFTVLVVAALLALMTLTVAVHSMNSLQRDHQVQGRLQADFAAQAGLQVALSQLRTSTLSGDLPQTALTGGRSSYAVTVLSNASGAVAVTAPDGTSVPPGAVYLMALGEGEGRHQQRISALALRPGSGGFDALAADSDILMRDNVQVDAWDPSLGAYGPATLSNFTLGSNIVSRDGIRVRDSALLRGDLQVGSGGSISNVVKISGSGTVTGSTSVATASFSVPHHTAPLPVGATDVILSGSTQTLGPGSYRRLRLSGSSQVMLSSGTYVFESLQMQDTSQLVALGAVTVYLTRGVLMDGDAQINPSGLGSNFKLYSTSSSPVSLRMNGRSRAWVTAEGDHLSLAPYDDAEFFGAFVGAGIDAWDRGKIHYDKSLRSGTVSASSSTAPWELRAIRYR